jgi:Cdc6-like AAA superfamily ATPase
MYISGMPGTGKTSCVLAVIKALKAESAIGNIPMFEFVLINGMHRMMLCWSH